MQTSTTLRRFSPSVIALALVATLVAALLIALGAQSLAQPAALAHSSNTAEQDLRMVMQEQERERLDQLNASAYIDALRTRAAAAQDLRMVMQELERERFPQLYAKPFDAASIPCPDLRVSCDR